MITELVESPTLFNRKDEKNEQYAIKVQQIWMNLATISIRKINKSSQLQYIHIYNHNNSHSFLKTLTIENIYMTTNSVERENEIHIANCDYQIK